VWINFWFPNLCTTLNPFNFNSDFPTFESSVLVPNKNSKFDYSLKKIMAGSALRRLMAEYKRKYGVRCFSTLTNTYDLPTYILPKYIILSMKRIKFYTGPSRIELSPEIINCVGKPKLFTNICIFDLELYVFIVLELTINPPEGIIAGPVNEENFFEWEALIT
jgi:Ubiquitin-protein ligase